MESKEDKCVFHPYGRDLLAPTIKQAALETVTRDFLKDCAVHIAVSSSIQVGDLVGPSMYVEGTGLFFSTDIQVTHQHALDGITWQLPFFNIVADSGARVSLWYTVKKSDEDDLSSPLGLYTVK